MRDIRFRAWDKEEKKMYPLVVVDNDGSWSPSVVDDDWHSEGVMQFTGLKDKNGKEIYEMDILKVDWGGIQDEYIINNKYDKPFVMEWRSYEYPPFSRYLPMPKDVEVIGNVYENPDLLKV